MEPKSVVHVNTTTAHLPASITIQFGERRFEEIERYRDIIHNLLASGGLDVKRGYTELHFDENGILQNVQVHVALWKRRRDQ